MIKSQFVSSNVIQQCKIVRSKINEIMFVFYEILEDDRRALLKDLDEYMDQDTEDEELIYPNLQQKRFEHIIEKYVTLIFTNFMSICRLPIILRVAFTVFRLILLKRTFYVLLNKETIVV